MFYYFVTNSLSNNLTILFLILSENKQPLSASNKSSTIRYETSDDFNILI